MARAAEPQPYPRGGDRDPLSLPRSLYRSIDLTCWLLAIIAGLAAWCAIFSLL